MSHSGDRKITKDGATKVSIEFVNVEEVDIKDVQITEDKAAKTSFEYDAVKEEVESSGKDYAAVGESIKAVKHDVVQSKNTVLFLKESETGKLFESCDKSKSDGITDGKKLYQCETCQKKFSWPQNLKAHQKKHSDTKDFKCEHCQKCFFRKDKLKLHLITHSGIKNFECAHCKKRFLRKEYLIGHLRIHSGVKNFECEHCKRSFLRKYSLQKHLCSGVTKITKDDTTQMEWKRVKIIKDDTVVKVKEEVELSDIGEDIAAVDESITVVKHEVDDYFLKSIEVVQPENTKLDLKEFVRGKEIHFSTKCFECEHCKKCFSRKGVLNEHLMIHSSIKNFECEHCKKRFTNKRYLTKHIKNHIGIKNLKCEHCKRRFSDKTYLKRHLVRHLGVKDFECEHCKKRFSHKSDLQRHLKRHSGIKDVQCEHCNMCFLHKTTLIKHLKICS